MFYYCLKQYTSNEDIQSKLCVCYSVFEKNIAVFLNSIFYIKNKVLIQRFKNNDKIQDS